jgi:hypothetical protein
VVGSLAHRQRSRVAEEQQRQRRAPGGAFLIRISTQNLEPLTQRFP